MTDGRDHSQYEDLIPAYVLGIADEAERNTVEAHVSECALCRASVAEYQTLGDALLYAAPPLQARVGLTEELRKRLNAEVTTAASAKRASWWRQPAWVLSLIAVALLFLTNIYWANRTVRTGQEIETLAMLTKTPGITLQASSDDSYASGVLYARSSARLALLCVYRLPELDANQTYQAWLVRGEERISAGTFQSNEAGYGVLLVKSAEPLGDFDGLGITVEPAGGSPAPTTPRVMGGEL